MENTRFIHIKDASRGKLRFTEPGRYVAFFHNLSGNLEFDIATPDVDLVILGLYLGRGREKHALSTVQHHHSPRSRSDLLIKGVFEDKAVFDYHGLIRIEKEASESHAFQKNQNILLSPGVFVSSKPDLEILADDVYCTHASTSGRLSREDLFYVQSRGVSLRAAKRLLVAGFAAEIFRKAAGAGMAGEAAKLENSILNSYEQQNS